MDTIIQSQVDLDTKFENLAGKVNRNTKSIDDIKQSLDFQDTTVSEIDTKVTDIETILKKHESEMAELKNSMSTLKTENNSLGRYTRSFNLRFLGIPETKGENCREVLHKLLKDNLEIGDDVIENAHRTGDRHKQDKRPRQIIARFYSRPVRNQVIRSARKADPSPPFVVLDDLTETDLSEKRRVLPLMTKLFEDGKRPRFHAGRLYVNGDPISELSVNMQLKALETAANDVGVPDTD